jgi:hypothetical protein
VGLCELLLLVELLGRGELVLPVGFVGPDGFVSLRFVSLVGVGGAGEFVSPLGVAGSGESAGLGTGGFVGLGSGGFVGLGFGGFEGLGFGGFEGSGFGGFAGLEGTAGF